MFPSYHICTEIRNIFKSLLRYVLGFLLGDGGSITEDATPTPSQSTMSSRTVSAMGDGRGSSEWSAVKQTPSFDSGLASHITSILPSEGKLRVSQLQPVYCLFYLWTSILYCNNQFCPFAYTCIYMYLESRNLFLWIIPWSKYQHPSYHS